MEIVKVWKRTIIYLLNCMMYTLIGYASALPFLLLLHVNIWIYIVIGLGFSVIISIAISFLILWGSKGYNVVCYMFMVKIVGEQEKNITPKQALIRAFCESVFIFAILDFIYLLSHRTERGVIDRLSNTFMIDLRR